MKVFYSHILFIFVVIFSAHVGHNSNHEWTRLKKNMEYGKKGAEEREKSKNFELMAHCGRTNDFNLKCQQAPVASANDHCCWSYENYTFALHFFSQTKHINLFERMCLDGRAHVCTFAIPSVYVLATQCGLYSLALCAIHCVFCW